MSYEAYTLIHLSGVFLVLMALGALAVHFFQGGTKESLRAKKMLYIGHGLGMFLILLGGFGMLARLGIHWPWPTWIIIKFSVWILLGGLIALIPRYPEQGRILWLFTFALALGAILSVYFRVP